MTSDREGLTPFPIEEVARFPLPGMLAPSDFAFSPDDRLLTYLWSAEGNLTRELYALDLATGATSLALAPPAAATTEEGLTPEERLRRERQRQIALGVTHYAWAQRRSRIVIPLRGGVTTLDGPGASRRTLVPEGGVPAIDPQLSPDGAWVAYVQNGELVVIPAEGGEPRQLTRGARETGRTHGLAEFIAQEEMSRSRGFWWSPDSRWLAFAEVDESAIPLYRIVHQGKDEVGEAAQEEHRYPFAGQANARVRLGVVALEGGDPVWMDLGPDDDVYLARVDWLPDGALTAQIENREQTQLDLLEFDPRTGASRRLLRETSDVWINLHDLFRPLDPDGPTEGGFIWASERSGFRHLYLYDRRGRLIRPVTAGDWQVDAVVAVDESRQQVFFLGTRDSPLERHLYAVSLAGGEPRRITAESGTHQVVVDHGCRSFVDISHDLDRPPTVAVRSLVDGAVQRIVDDVADPRVGELGLAPPELVTVTSRDGVRLHGAIYRPPASFGAGPFPTIVSVYGGPHAQMVTRGWSMTVAMRAQYLRRLGFLVFVLDNRGSARRGLAFEGAIKHRLGHREVQDQVDGVRWLVERGLADPRRVGIYGWSYGGYLAAMCLAREPGVFKVAVAGAPVTHFDGYDTHYTERYLGTPRSNPEGYRDSSVMRYVDGMRGKLLLIHGLIDENVHFRHTARLINALIAARKPYDLLLFPDERHLPRRLADRVYLEERVRDYFLANL